MPFDETTWRQLCYPRPRVCANCEKERPPEDFPGQSKYCFTCVPIGDRTHGVAVRARYTECEDNAVKEDARHEKIMAEVDAQLKEARDF